MDMQWKSVTSTLQWHSIRDALPPERMYVLVVDPNTGSYNNERAVWWALYFEGKFYDVLDKNTDTPMEVTHWMKPPELPIQP